MQAMKKPPEDQITGLVNAVYFGYTSAADFEVLKSLVAECASQSDRIAALDSENNILKIQCAHSHNDYRLRDEAFKELEERHKNVRDVVRIQKKEKDDIESRLSVTDADNKILRQGNSVTNDLLKEANDRIAGLVNELESLTRELEELRSKITKHTIDTEHYRQMFFLAKEDFEKSASTVNRQRAQIASLEEGNKRLREELAKQK